jgi:hypothetical protein
MNLSPKKKKTAPDKRRGLDWVAPLPGLPSFPKLLPETPFRFCQQCLQLTRPKTIYCPNSGSKSVPWLFFKELFDFPMLILGGGKPQKISLPVFVNCMSLF